VAAAVVEQREDDNLGAPFLGPFDGAAGHDAELYDG
jgi:hypothetical protein